MKVSAIKNFAFRRLSTNGKLKIKQNRPTPELHMVQEKERNGFTPKFNLFLFWLFFFQRQCPMLMFYLANYRKLKQASLKPRNAWTILQKKLNKLEAVYHP